MHHHQNQVRSFLRQIAISLELLVFLFCASNRTYRHPRRARKAHTHTHTQIHSHTDSCHASHAFHAHARPFTRARQFCHNGEKYAAETSVNPAGEGGGAGEAWFHRVEQLETHGKRDDTFRGVHRLHGNARATERAPGKPCGMSADITSLELNGTRLSRVIETSFDSSYSSRDC